MNNGQTNIREHVEYIVKQLVRNPNAVRIGVEHDGSRHVIEIQVDERDRGIVIGKGGATIKALQTLIEVMMPRGEKVSVNIVD